MSDIPLCSCGEFYQSHHPQCPARKYAEGLNQELAISREAAAEFKSLHEAVCTSLRGCEAQLAAANARAEALEDRLVRSGFVRCDLPACNCGSWHQRYGLPERMAEIRTALADAGHPPCNDNGNQISNALNELIQDRDELLSRNHEAREIYAGMDGFQPETAPEGYCLRIIEQMHSALAALEQEKGVTCSRCGGKGWIPVYHDDTEQCPKCKGEE
jgi:hypothetical protein